MVSMTICEYCTSENKRDGRFCSQSCAAKWGRSLKPRIQHYETCLKCGISFAKRYPTEPRKFCSKPCSTSYANTIAPKRSRASGIYECLNCSKRLVNNRAYCSRKCFQEARLEKKIESWLELGDFGNGEKTSVPLYARTYILQQQKGVCEICFIPPVWLGHPLTFVADHIDGDSTNNKRDNLRLICPNCDGQLPTFCGKNLGKGRAYRRDRYANGQSY